MRNSQMSNISTNDPYVQTALNYINNDTKPTKTVITQSHPEKAANKPIIRGKLNNKLGKMFCGSAVSYTHLTLPTIYSV